MAFEPNQEQSVENVAWLDLMTFEYANVTTNKSDSGNMSSGYENEEGMLRHSMLWTIVLICAYCAIFLIGIVGNVMVVCVLTMRSQMRNVTNLFILNLAIADLLVVIFCVAPTLLANIFVPWILGSFMCKAVAYVQGVSVCASVYSLVAVSLDRFLAIWFPMRIPRGLTKFQARITIFCIWFTALTITLPWTIVFSVVISEKDGQHYCVDTWPSSMDGGLYFIIANLLLCYGLPLTLISISNGLIWWYVAKRKIPQESASPAAIKRVHKKTRHGVLKMLSVVTFTFLLSWLPLYLIFLRVKFGGPLSEWMESLISISMPFAQWLGASNSSCNPILYAFLNKKFRDSFKSLIKCPKLLQAQNMTMSHYSTTMSAYHRHSLFRGRRVTFRNPVVRV